MSKRYAILSVSDKQGLESFAKGLIDLGFSILSTGGTAKLLKEFGISFEKVSDFTGQNEILGGRVKTLHPKVHAGILSRRENDSDRQEMKEGDYSYIDLVAVNLYPFVRVLEEKGDSLTLDEMVEFIDIGGPTMLRASAKNFSSVYSVIDPSDYDRVLDAIRREDASDNLVLRKELAAKVFASTASYDLAIAEYLSKQSSENESSQGVSSSYTGLVLQNVQTLRYGENPHQSAGWYKKVSTASSEGVTGIRQLQGKELSYNNLNDIAAALELALDLNNSNFGKDFSVVIKHANPCGIALGASVIESFKAALACDPVSAFGGIIAFSNVLDEETASLICDAFYEVVIAPEVSPASREILSKKKNLRVLEVDFKSLMKEQKTMVQYKSIFGTMLLQSTDDQAGLDDQAKWVSGDSFTGTEKEDAELAWVAAKHVKSNAITFASGGRIIGVGAGQMNRVDSCRIAIDRANRYDLPLKGSVVASDAFFPFADSIDVFKEVGVSLVIQPGGSLRDEEVIQAAKDASIKMLLTGRRHFRH